MPRIAVVGSANMDLVARVAEIPRPGETVQARALTTHPGGKGANQAVAAGRLAAQGTEVFFVGCIGEDEHGEDLRQSLQGSNVDTAHLLTTGVEPTGTALIAVDDAGQNSIVVVPGANARLSAHHVANALTAVRPDIVLVQLEIPDEAVAACAGHGRLILDPAPARRLEGDFLSRVWLATPNETESLALTGILPNEEFSWRRAAELLMSQGVRSVALKLGPSGAYFTDGHDELHVPAPRVDAVDTTAAGDCLSGALGVFLAEGEPMELALKNAVLSASLSVTREGAQSSMPWRKELTTG